MGFSSVLAWIIISLRIASIPCLQTNGHETRMEPQQALEEDSNSRKSFIGAFAQMSIRSTTKTSIHVQEMPTTYQPVISKPTTQPPTTRGPTSHSSSGLVFKIPPSVPSGVQKPTTGVHTSAPSIYIDPCAGPPQVKCAVANNNSCMRSPDGNYTCMCGNRYEVTEDQKACILWSDLQTAAARSRSARDQDVQDLRLPDSIPFTGYWLATYNDGSRGEVEVTSTGLVSFKMGRAPTTNGRLKYLGRNVSSLGQNTSDVRVWQLDAEFLRPAHELWEYSPTAAVRMTRTDGTRLYTQGSLLPSNVPQRRTRPGTCNFADVVSAGCKNLGLIFKPWGDMGVSLTFDECKKKCEEYENCVSFSWSAMGDPCRLFDGNCDLLDLAKKGTVLSGISKSCWDYGNICAKSLGVRDGDDIPSTRFNASGWFDKRTAPDQGRLYGRAAWCSGSKRGPTPWLGVDFGAIKIVTGVVTQGFLYGLSQAWVSSFVISYKLHWYDPWTTYPNGPDPTIVSPFSGNTDANSLVQHIVDPPIEARWVRLEPRTWTGNQPCLRFDLQGCAGGKGRKGNPGVPGVQGVNGPPGTARALGPGLIGLQGQQGPPGYQGLDGLMGPKGAPGPTGPTGPGGSEGDLGYPGLRGAVGPKGLAGLPGSPGTRGWVGPTGLRGAPGRPGLDGSAGGTGPAGPLGRRGYPGHDGYRGIDGGVGLPGPQGPPGKLGRQGDTGDPGATGPAGPDGLDGQNGRRGLPGPKGSWGGQSVALVLDQAVDRLLLLAEDFSRVHIVAEREQTRLLGK